MLIDAVLANPLLRKALATGEEQVGKAVAKLLASEGVTGGLQTLFSTAAQAREALGKGVSQALHAANLPSRDDMAALKRRLEELEVLLDGLAEKVEPAAGAGRAGDRRAGPDRDGGGA